jgi:hypothetical protein
MLTPLVTALWTLSLHIVSTHIGLPISYSPSSRPPLWPSGQSSWQQIERSGFHSRCCQIFWEAVGLERRPLSFVSTIEELLGRESSDFGLEIREYGDGDPLRWLRDTFYPQKLALISPTSGGRSVGIVCSRTTFTEFFTQFIAKQFFQLFNDAVTVKSVPRCPLELYRC